MRNVKFFFLGTIFIFGLNHCKRTSDPSHQNPILCPAIYRIPIVAVKILDKSTGNNLLYGPNAKFKVNQIQVVSSQTGLGPLPDSAGQTIGLIGGGYQVPETVSLTLPGYATDNFIITTASDGKSCPQPLVTQVVLNGQTVCSPCNNYIVTLLK